MDGLSIIISAYNSSDYIIECLNSIRHQMYFHNHNNYEILLGVDHCESTLKTV